MGLVCECVCVCVCAGLPQTSVVGTSLAAMAVPATAGLIQHARLGNVDWRMAAGKLNTYTHTRATCPDVAHKDGKGSMRLDGVCVCPRVCVCAGLVAGVCGGAYSGSHVALHAPPYVLEAAFALGMLFLGHRTLAIANASKVATAVSKAAKP